MADKPKLYRKKPVIIEAMQFTYPPSQSLVEWAGRAMQGVRKDRHPTAKGMADIVTLEDGIDAASNRVRHIATEGDWIIKGIHGEFYPCKPDIFEKTYEEANHG